MRRSPGARAWIAVVGLVSAIAVIGWLDYASGPEIGFAVFYLLPVLAAGWWLGIVPVIPVALVGSAAWFLADVAGHTDRHVGVSVWNGFTRLAIFLAIGLLTARVRRDRDRLDDLLRREKELARTDALTALPNSRDFMEHLLVESSRARRESRPLAVAYLDLDNFKELNDRYGHAAGDQVLVRVARTIQTAVRAGDRPARLGGDEFAILFWNADRRSMERIAHRIIEGVRVVVADYPKATLGASIGIACFDVPPESAEEALRRADIAMYSAKAAGKGRVVVSPISSGGAHGPWGREAFGVGPGAPGDDSSLVG